MWLEVVTSPQIAHCRLADALIRRHEPTTPVSHPLRFRLQRGVDHGFDPLGTVGGLAAPARCDVPKARQSFRDKTFAPEANRFPIDIHLGGDGPLGFTVASRE